MSPIGGRPDMVVFALTQTREMCFVGRLGVVSKAAWDGRHFGAQRRYQNIPVPLKVEVWFAAGSVEVTGAGITGSALMAARGVPAMGSARWTSARCGERPSRGRAAVEEAGGR